MATAVSLPALPPTTSAAAYPHASLRPSSNQPSVEPWHNDGSPPLSPASSSTVVPQYPFTVSLPYIPGSNANLSGYFANASNQPLPDDSDVQTRLPSICVDYLSHNWREDDIWTSWKAMTKHKADLANGVRLENASWRTWAKQRSKLRTISPETLNWLKDSDVTWLYGPLHTAVDPVPPAKAATMEDRLNLDPQTQARHAANPLTARDVRARAAKLARPKKPILKHRSLSDILSVPSRQSRYEFDEDDSSEGTTISPDRPPMIHTRSDPLSTAMGRISQSPNGIERSPDLRPHQTRSASDRSAGSTDDIEHPRKHISFNHYVEQCIAVDSEDDSGRSYASDTSSATDDDDDEDEALSFRSSPRVGPHLLGKLHTSLHLDKEPHTIAKLAPTILKSSELIYPSPCPAVVFNGQILTGAPLSPAPEADPVMQNTIWSDRSSSGKESPAPPTPTSQWDEDEDFSSVGYDYFGESADFGVGEEYASTNGVATHTSRRKPEQTVSSPNIASGVASEPRNRSIMKARAAHSSDTNLSASPPKPSYAAAATQNAATSIVPRGRSISRGSSSSSLDRSGSADARRASGGSSPVVSDNERGRSSGHSRSNLRSSSSASSLNGSTTSLNDLASSPSSQLTIPATYNVADGLPLPSSSDLTRSSSASSSSASLSAGLTPPSPSPEVLSAPIPHMEQPLEPVPGPSYHVDVPRVDSVDFEKDPALLFGSPAMPSSPNSSSVALPRNNSFSALQHGVRWSDDDPSPARRALLRAQARSATSGERPTSDGGRRASADGSLTGDDYGLSYASFDDEERGGVVSRAVDIVGTARDLVGALWTVAFRRG